MKNYELFNQIIDSYHKLQFAQFKLQVSRYGKKAFFHDILNSSMFEAYAKVDILKMAI